MLNTVWFNADHPLANHMTKLQNSSATIQSYHLKVYWPSTCYSKLEFVYQNIWTYAIYHITANKINLLQQIGHSGTYVACHTVTDATFQGTELINPLLLHNTNSLINDFVSVN